ncbi:MAG TPA: phytase [Candidatus Binatia bacterium]
MKKSVQNDNEANNESTSAEISRRVLGRRAFLKGALATAPLLIAGPTLLLPKKTHAAPEGNMGPSTTTEPYLVPSVPGVKFISILTVGDVIGNYRMVGIPDGLGAFNSGKENFTLLMNHEITNARPGIVRAHGSNGAFVSKWTIDRNTLKVLTGEDLTPSPNHVYLWDPVHEEFTQGTTQWQRLCSADLPARSALFADDRGAPDRIFFDGEEVTDAASARAWARIVTGPHAGEAWQLPLFGRMPYENVVACPHAQHKTIVVLLDDGDLSTAATTTGFPCEVYVYIGRKVRHGHPIEQAGLTNGALYGVKISVEGNPVSEESDLFGLGTTSTGFIDAARFSLHNLGDVSNLTIRQFEDLTQAAGVARLQRVEDGAWDPRKKHQNDFYFVTTGNIDPANHRNSRLWRLRFDNIEHPEKGGIIEILLKGDEGHEMLDNVTIDRHGRILMDEDPGNNPRVSKVWLYSIDTDELIQVAQHNPKFFDPTILSSFITQDEESSGIIDAEHVLGRGWFFLDVQAHKLSPDTDPELVEGGQLLAMYVDPRIGKGNDHDDEQDSDDG